MRAARIGGHVLHYRLDGPWAKEGDGPILVFSNSLGTDLRVWDPLLPHLPPSWRLLRYDTAGHGLSEHPGPYSIAEHARDLLGLMDRLEISHAVVVGLSVGGQIAQFVAATAPERVSALALCDTAPKIGDAETWNQRIAGVEAGGIASLADAVLQRWFSESYRRNQPEALALWRSMLLRTPAKSYTALCAALRDADLTASTAALKLPTLCVVGSEDLSTPSASVRSMAESIGGARFSVIEGAGHLPCVEAPAELAAEIAGFLKENALD